MQSQKQLKCRSQDGEALGNEPFYQDMLINSIYNLIAACFHSANLSSFFGLESEFFYSKCLDRRPISPL